MFIDHKMICKTNIVDEYTLEYIHNYSGKKARLNKVKVVHDGFNALIN